jgi:hypothetical protein
MTIDEGVTFFSAITKIRNGLQTLVDVGLGYIKLGQSAIIRNQEFYKNSMKDVQSCIFTVDIRCKIIFANSDSMRDYVRPNQHNTKLCEYLSRLVWPSLTEYLMLKAQKHAYKFIHKFIKTLS